MYWQFAAMDFPAGTDVRIVKSTPFTIKHPIVIPITAITGVPTPVDGQALRWQGGVLENFAPSLSPVEVLDGALTGFSNTSGLNTEKFDPSPSTLPTSVDLDVAPYTKGVWGIEIDETIQPNQPTTGYDVSPTSAIKTTQYNFWVSSRKLAAAGTYARNMLHGILIDEGKPIYNGSNPVGRQVV